MESSNRTNKPSTNENDPIDLTKGILNFELSPDTRSQKMSFGRRKLFSIPNKNILSKKGSVNKRIKFSKKKFLNEFFSKFSKKDSRRM